MCRLHAGILKPHTCADWCSGLQMHVSYIASCSDTTHVRQPQVMGHRQDTHLNTSTFSAPSCLQ